MTRKFFQIGFNKCGTTFIERLFRLNGIPVRHWEKGALAEDIAYSKLTGRAPLRRWADTVAFTDMESVRFVHAPVIEAFRDFAYLDRCFPGAVFLLNTRRVEDWIASRYRHQGGSYARAHAMNRGVALADLGDLWRADWDAHLAACRAHFGDRPEFIEIDIDAAEPEDYRRALSRWFDLPKIPDLPGVGRVESRKAYAAEVTAMLAARQPGSGIDEEARERMATSLARFAVPARIETGPRDLPGITRFDAALGELRNAAGDLLPIRRMETGRYLADPLQPGHLLIAAAANDIAELVDRGVYHLDMRDDCLIGTSPRTASGGPVLTPSRREGAANVFLWPMPRFHRLGNNAFLGPDPNAVTQLDQRLDRAIWQGGLSGYAPGANGPGLMRPAHRAVDLILRSEEGSPRHQAALADLQENSRIAFVRRWQGSGDVDVRLIPEARAAQALRKAGLGSLIFTDAAGDALHSHRFTICLGGAPLAEEFLPALNAGGVVLKEEDGWQLYHSGVIRPWEHYIPLDYGAGDLADKLDWARENPRACARMVAAAHRVCAALADPAGRRRHLALVLEGYRAATGQD
ncbi:glycosyltransferase family protein [Paracoccus zhejiangensis]|uniref:glycosyl transferase family 90 n=1 Tax=Paracoccus zhejiangensis TaxID=1077935 RepID=UPI0012FFF456|nr:glycosyl transferase family 90 [Paracoccus zhejiangensis]